MIQAGGVGGRPGDGGFPVLEVGARGNGCTRTRAGHIAVVGSGYVGTVVAACFASIGRSVVGVEPDRERLAALRRGRAHFHEADLDPLLSAGLRSGRLRFTPDLADGLAGSSVVFICVGAPSSPDGRTDLADLEAAARGVAQLRTDQVIVIKTTVPVGTSRRLASLIGSARPASAVDGLLPVVSNPEFLREGRAVTDFLVPDRIVLGSDCAWAVDAVVDLYRPILDQTFAGAVPDHRPALVRTTPTTAEVVKYASNAFLAMKVSFANEISNICELISADVTEATAALGLDRRIGPSFLAAGVGWGGSCFGKDLAVLRATAREFGYEPRLLDEVAGVNRYQRRMSIEKLRRHLRTLAGRRICLLGLAFKPGTDDVRDAPALDMAAWLLREGARVSAYDPVVGCVPSLPGLEVHGDPYAAAESASAVVLVTDWPEFLDLDLERLRGGMRGNLFVDGRNLFEPPALRRAGFVVESFGRSQPEFSASLVDLPATSELGGLARPVPDPVPVPVLRNGTGNGNGRADHGLSESNGTVGDEVLDLVDWDEVGTGASGSH